MKKLSNHRNTLRVLSIVLFGFLGRSVQADTVRYSFNNEVVAVQSSGTMYNIPLAVFRSQFGEPEYGKQIVLDKMFLKYKVNNQESESNIRVSKISLGPKFFNYGGIYYKQYGQAFARMETDQDDGEHFETWTTLPSPRANKVERTVASTEPTPEMGYLINGGEKVVSGRLVQTESSEVFVIDDGKSLYWVKNTNAKQKDNCFARNEVLWTTKYKQN